MFKQVDMISHRIDNVVKSVEDKRLYRCFMLKNNLKVILVSDPATDKASASLDVHVGYSCDPDNVPGLAHFCEHMLFLGTKKYPDENAYNKYLNENGGCCNAFTTFDHTQYYFDVIPEALNGAIDRFAQFFIEPLFTENMTEREINAVDSENQKNILSDVWRFYSMIHHLSNKDHPYHKFGTGNKATLETIPKQNGISIRDELLKFHNRYYSANIMALAVLGKESLDELEAMVVEKFSIIENKDIPVEIWTESPFQKQQLPMITYLVPVKDIRKMSIHFPIESLISYYKSSPDGYISHLIGHEGAGSLLSCLKKYGWCNNLCACGQIQEKGFNLFSVTVDLTEDGVNHVEDIVKLLFQYINLLKKSEPQYWVHEENARLSEMNFRFKDKESPMQYMQQILTNAHNVPLEEVLSAHYLISEWNPEKISDILNELTPENAIIFVTSKSYEDKVTMEEPWYGVKYVTEKVKPEVLKSWSDGSLNEHLALPTKNDFIPSCFDLYPLKNENNTFPTIIHDSDLSRVWFKQDDEFLLPKSVMEFQFVCPLINLDPLNLCMSSLFLELLKDSLNELTYSAKVAGLNYELMNQMSRILLEIKGFNEKQVILLEKIVEKMTNFTFSDDRFRVYKDLLLRSLNNFYSNQPYQLSQYYLHVLLTEKFWTKGDQLAVANDITAEMLRKFIPEMLSRIHIESFLYGNLDEKEAHKTIEMIEFYFRKSFELIPLMSSQLLLNRELKLSKGSSYLYEIDNDKHNCSATDIVYQCGIQSTENNMLLTLLLHIIGEPAFNVLRTMEQLGYIVASIHRKTNGVQSLNMLVQSDKTPAFVEERIECFIESVEKILHDMTDDEFVKHRDAVVALILEKPKKISKKAKFLWNEIVLQQYNFNRNEIEANYLKTVDKSQIIKFYQNKIKSNGPERQKMSVHMISKMNKNNVTANDKVAMSTDVKVVTDIVKFKTELDLYPIAQPYINVAHKGHKCKL